ncbi:MAG: DNA polymerase III alpha subunit [Rickettsiales bacterium]|jgi:DNA polymerase III alpha subunit
MAIEVKKYDNHGNEMAIRFGLGGIKAVGVGMTQDMIDKRQKNGGFKDIYDFAGNAGTKAVNKKSLEALAKSGSFDSIHPSRSQIVESVEMLCKYSSSKEEEKNSNQMNLFASSLINDKPTLKKTEDWDQDTKLQEEFKAFGFFLNEHPIDSFLEGLGKRGVISSEDLEDLSDNNIIKLAGVVAYSRHKSGPKGRYAYLTLSDPFGIFETAIFDEELITAYRDIMADGSRLVVECLVRKDEGGSRYLVKTLESLDKFIQITTPRKEAYKDIRQQEKREFNWKKRAGEKTDSKNDSLVREIENKRKLDILRNKKIINQIEVKISRRETMLNLKSFLSQRTAPEEFDKFSTVYFLIENAQKELVKIAVEGKYLLDDEDFEKIKKISTN